MENNFIKKCPQCEKEIIYSNKKALNASIKYKTLCRSCAKINDHKIEKQFKRQCSICNKDIFHSTEKQLNLAIQHNNPCGSCAQKIFNSKPKNFKRNCLHCGKEINYVKESTMKKAELENKPCRSCRASGKNNPMYGVHRFGEENPMYGKTVYEAWLEKYGKEEADIKHGEWKLSFKKNGKNKGVNNPNHNGKYSKCEQAIKWVHDNQKGKKLEQIYGEEKSKEIKQKLSDKSSGENNPMFGKPAPKRSGNGWSGYYKDHYFRSMLELHYLIYLIDNNIQFESGEKRKHAIQYKINEVTRNYFPDYYLLTTDEYIELKPKKLINSYQNKLKFDAAKNKLKNKFKIITDEEIVKIDLQIIYNKYIYKEIIFDKGYSEKFENYYFLNRKEDKNE